MPLIDAKCTNCGAHLEVDRNNETAICKYCNSSFIVEKAIQNFNTYINVDGKEVDFGTDTAESLAKSIIKLININDYDSASHMLGRLKERYISDYRSYWCEILINTRNLNAEYCFKKYGSIEIFESIKKKAFALAPETYGNIIKNEYFHFAKKIEELETQRRIKQEQEKAEREEQERLRLEEIKRLEAIELEERERLLAEEKRLKKEKYKKIAFLCALVIIICTIAVTIRNIKLSNPMSANNWEFMYSTHVNGGAPFRLNLEDYESGISIDNQQERSKLIPSVKYIKKGLVHVTVQGIDQDISYHEYELKGADRAYAFDIANNYFFYFKDNDLDVLYMYLVNGDNMSNTYVFKRK